MAWIQFSWRRTRVPSFFSAVIDGCVFLVALLVLGRIVWHYPALRLDAAVYIAVLMLVLLSQFLRIQRVYAASRQIAVGDDTLARALREMLRTFRWGCFMVMLLSLGVLWSWSLVR